MNPDDIREFAGKLEPLLSGFVRHDLPLSGVEPSPAEDIPVVEFVAAPIGFVKGSLALGWSSGWPGHQRRMDVVFQFLHLYCPSAEEFNVGVARTRGLRAHIPLLRNRWAIGPDSVTDEAAREIAGSVGPHWNRAVYEIGSAEAYVRELRWDAAQSSSWLEILAYSFILMGDWDGARRSLAHLLKGYAHAPGLTEEMAARARQMETLLASDTGAAIDRLFKWRVERLGAQGLLHLAAADDDCWIWS